MKLWQMLPVPILLLSSACALGSIGREPSPPAIHPRDLCRLTVPITYDSTTDNADTVAQIEAFDAVWISLCEAS